MAIPSGTCLRQLSLYDGSNEGKGKYNNCQPPAYVLGDSSIHDLLEVSVSGKEPYISRPESDLVRIYL